METGASLARHVRWFLWTSSASDIKFAEENTEPAAVDFDIGVRETR